MKTILVPFKSLFTRTPHRNASFHFVTCDFYSFITKVGVVGHCLINTNWMLCLHSRSNKIPCSERVFFKIHMKSPPLRALESCIYIPECPCSLPGLLPSFSVLAGTESTAKGCQGWRSSRLNSPFTGRSSTVVLVSVKDGMRASFP